MARYVRSRILDIIYPPRLAKERYRSVISRLNARIRELRTDVARLEATVAELRRDRLLRDGGRLRTVPANDNLPLPGVVSWDQR